MDAFKSEPIVTSGFAMDNLSLAEYLHTQEIIKQMERRLADLKSWLKARGSFSTDKYSVAVKPQTRVGVAGMPKFLEKGFDREWLESKDLLTISEFQTIHVVENKNLGSAEEIVNAILRGGK